MLVKLPIARVPRLRAIRAIDVHWWLLLAVCVDPAHIEPRERVSSRGLSMSDLSVSGFVCDCLGYEPREPILG